MPTMKRIAPWIVLLILGAVGLFGYLQTNINSQSDQPPVTASSTTPSSNDQTEEAEQKGPTNQSPETTIRQFVQHHCTKLKEPGLISNCVDKVLQEILAGNLEPNIPELDPNACDNIKEPNKQHKCHGWLSHDFAISSANIKGCQVIPFPEIKTSCQQAIVINEIKALYALENNTESENPQP